MLEQPSKREEAETALAGVTDPRAVPSIMHSFGTARPADQLLAVQLLGQVESPAASRSMAGLAVLSKSAEVRRAALETLKGRDPRDFVRLWIALVRKTIKFEVRPVGGPGSPGSLFVEGERANLRRIYAPPAMPSIPNLGAAHVTYDANGLPVLSYDVSLGNSVGFGISERQLREAEQARQQAQRAAKATLAGNPNAPAAFKQALERTSNDPTRVIANVGQGTLPGATYRPVFADGLEVDIPIGEMMLESQASAAVAQQQLSNDVAALESANDSIRRTNDSVILALKTITGGDLGDDRAAWNHWWTDQLGYASATTTAPPPIPTVVENVPLGYTPTATPSFIPTASLLGYERVAHHSCFAAGTTVRTIDGDRPIESIRAGDLVLSEDTRGGSFGYRAVITAFHNPPSPTLKIRLGEADAVVATGIHRFWKAGKGWTMARDLKPGDLVRTLGGVATVAAVEKDRVQPVFNLELAEGNSFLVGRLGTLVHDNSLVEATPNPFDAPPAPAVVANAKAAK